MAKRKTHEEFIEEISVKNPNIEILGKYINSREKIKVRCKNCGHIWEVRANHLIQGTGCPTCYRNRTRNTHEEFMMKLFEVNIHANDFEVLDEYYNSTTKITCRCKICGSKWRVKPSILLSDKTGCPVCANRQIIHGINDVATLNPELVKYFVNPEDAKKYSTQSNQYVLLRCPDCGEEKYMQVFMLVSRGFNCGHCSDKISYPNKYLRGFLKQFNLSKVIYEYSPEWAKPYRYDGYFIYKSKKYVIEMDGRFHYNDNNMSNITADMQKYIDNIKDNLALEHNIVVIRIDSQKSDSEYISNNIKNSILKDIFDLSKVNWCECEVFATSNIAKEVCLYYEKNKSSKKEISNLFGISNNTVLKYLKTGNNLGWCNYLVKNNVNIERKKVITYDINKNMIYQFNSIHECSTFMTNKYNKCFDRHYISEVCKGKKESYKGFIFKYA